MGGEGSAAQIPVGKALGISVTDPQNSFASFQYCPFILPAYALGIRERRVLAPGP